MADILDIPSYQRSGNRVIPATRLNAYSAFGGKSGVQPTYKTTSSNLGKSGYGVQKGSNFVTKAKSGIAGWWDDATKFMSHPEIPEVGKGLAKQIPKALVLDGIINPTELGRGSDTFAPAKYDGSQAVNGAGFNMNRDYGLNTIDLNSTLNNATSPRSAFALNGSYPNLPAQQPIATSPAIKPPVLSRKGASAVADRYNASTLPPLVAPTVVPSSVATQPQVVATNVPEAAQPVSPMEVAIYNAKANSEIADKNNQTLRDVAQMGAKSDWEKYGSLASGVGTMAGGLAGIYGAYQNAKYQKDQTKMQKAMIRGDEANKSAFAKAAGGTYQSSGV